MIFLELKKYATSKLGTDGWTTLLDKAGLAKKVFLPSSNYPDEDVLALVTAASNTTGLSVSVILEDFGTFIAPGLLGMYKNLINPAWKTLDLLVNTEEVIHKVVRLRNPGAEPPELECRRVSGNEVVVVYKSKRKMCFLAKGIVRGVAMSYKEKVAVRESSCMHGGASSCQIHVSLQS